MFSEPLPFDPNNVPHDKQARHSEFISIAPVVSPCAGFSNIGLLKFSSNTSLKHLITATPSPQLCSKVIAKSPPFVMIQEIDLSHHLVAPFPDKNVSVARRASFGLNSRRSSTESSRTRLKIEESMAEMEEWFWGDLHEGHEKMGSTSI